MKINETWRTVINALIAVLTALLATSCYNTFGL